MILIVDDDKAIRLSLSLLLKRKGYNVETASSPDEAMAVVREQPLQLILMDMNYREMSTGREGITLLRQVKIFQPDVPVILITAWGTIPLAVEGMQAGAFDFITKPWDNRMLLNRIETALSLSAPTTEVADGEFDRSAIIGKNKELNSLLDTVRRIAPTDAPVLILGEDGTGKELVAQAIHANSRRRDNPFVMVNLGGIPPQLFESEMFGHAKGAFTGAVSARTGRFEMADKGTIFLDEIGDLDLSCQVKMLRVLQQHTFEPLGDSRQRKVDLRVVCATNAPLEQMVRERTFREDLYYRINLITLRLPALRERRDDIPLLVNHFVRQNARELNIDIPEVSSEAMTLLTRLPYPGNIRELKNIVERAMLVRNDEHRLDIGDFNITETADSNRTCLTGGTLDDMERQAIVNALDKHDGNLSQAAISLGITRQSLYRRMEKYGIKQ